MTPTLFSELGLSPEIQQAIDRLGFEQASPIQAEAIPWLMKGRDVVGQSQTGSGKTAAFAVPAVEKVDPNIKAVQALILCPTRELAVQVSEEVHKLAFFKRGIHALPIYGGQSYERQFYGLKQGAQIVIGTPGRVMDHMRRGTLRLDTVKMAILDEADVMLDMGFRDDIEFILQAVPPERQTVFFSATMPRAIQELIQKYSRDPQNVRVEQKAVTVPTVEQVYYEVDRRFKVELLTRLIDIHDLKLGIVFCNTKRMVDDLVDHLNAQGYSADRLHGDMTQMMRDRVMQKFRKSGLEFLVATDVAARGIDVNDVEVVFNYDLPYDAEDYVHRIGRTGRAGRSGRAISFAAGREVFQIRQIERYTNVRIHRAKVPTLVEVEEARNNVFLNRIREILGGTEHQRQEHLVERLLEEGFTSTDIAAALFHHLQAGEPAAVPKPKDKSSEASWLAGGSPAVKAAPRAPAAPAARPPKVTTPAKAAAEKASEVPAPEAVIAEAPAVQIETVHEEVQTVHEEAATETPASAVEETPDDVTNEDTAAAEISPANEEAAAPEKPAPKKAPATPTATRKGPFASPTSRAPSERPSRLAPPSAPRERSAYSDRNREGGGPRDRGYSRPDDYQRPARSDDYQRSSRPGEYQRPARQGDYQRPGDSSRPPYQDRRRDADSSSRDPRRAPARDHTPPWAAPRGRDAERDRPAYQRRDDRKPDFAEGSTRRASRSTPGDQTRLYMNIGSEMGVAPGDVVGAILGETGLPGKTVGTVDVRERHVFVDVSAEHASAIISKLNRAQIKGRRLKVKVA